MKILSDPQTAVRATRLALGAFVVALHATVFSPCTLAADASAPDGKDHTLFVGIDMALPRDGTFYRVKRATDKGLEIDVNHQAVVVPVAKAGNLRLTKGLKLSNLTATVSNLKSETFNRETTRAQFDAMRAYTTLNDAASAAADRAQGGLVRADMGGGTKPPNPYSGKLESAFQESFNVFDAVQGTVDAGRFASSTFLFENMRGQSASDTVEATFEVSSPRALRDPYVVLFADFSAPDKPNNIVRGVAVRALEQLGPKPKKMRMELNVNSAALPPGAELKGVHVSVYAEGQELATNLSDHQMRLTKDEAHTYFVLNYVGSHAGETRPATPMLMAPRDQVKARAEAARVNQVVYASVNKEGSLLALSMDEAGTRKVSPEIEAVMQDVRFVPALEKGQPVDGRVKLNPAELLN